MTSDELAILRSLVLARFRVESCVISAKVLLEYLAARGEFGRALAVETLIWRSGWSAGTRAVQLGGPGDGAGHVVVLTRWQLIDLALDQAARPDRGLDLQPTAFSLAAEQHAALLEGKTVSWQRNASDLLVAYTGLPRDKRYTASPNWGSRDRALRARLVGTALRQTRALHAPPGAPTLRAANGPDEGLPTRGSLR